MDKGQVLARLEDNDYKQQARLDQAAIRVSGAQLQLDLAGTRRQEIAADAHGREAMADLAQSSLIISVRRRCTSSGYLKGVGLDVLWPEMLVLLVTAAGVLMASVLRFRKSLD